jgi:hypothetical protein
MPQDPTPHGGEVLHPLPERAKIPQPKPGGREAEQESRSPDEPNIADRPSLPEHPQRMAVDDASPGPQAGKASGRTPDDDKPSVTQQPA